MAILFQNSRSLSGRERGLCLEEKAPKTQASAGSQMRRNVIWNIIGSLCMAASTVVLMSAAGRIGEAEGALFAAALTMAQQLAVIGYFEVRAIQVTDVDEKHAFADYLGFRLITCAVMFIGCAAYGIFTGQTRAAMLAAVLIGVYKMTDAFADVFEGEFQKRGRLDLSGVSMAVRVLLSVGAFCVAAVLTRNVTAAILAALFGQCAALFVTDLRPVKHFSGLRVRFEKEQMRGIFADCVMLFIGNFLLLYLMNAAKYAGERYLSDADYYRYTAALFLPAYAINLVSNFLFRPVLVTMSEQYRAGEYAAFEKLVGKLRLGIAGITAAGLAAAAIAGIPVLELMYPVDLSGCLPGLLLVILGGGLYAVGIILYYVDTVMRRQTALCLAYLLAVVITLPLPYLLVKRGGLMGACTAFALEMVILVAVLAADLMMAWRKVKKGGARA